MLLEHNNKNHSPNGSFYTSRKGHDGFYTREAHHKEVMYGKGKEDLVGNLHNSFGPCTVGGYVST